MTTRGIARQRRPEVPGTPSMGEKAATVVSTANTTGTPTERVPSIAEPRASPPSRWWV